VISGSVAGRYASVGVRLRTVSTRRPSRPIIVERSPANGDGGGTGSARLDVEPMSGGPVRLVVRVPGAATVELAGDFTDWQPIALRRSAEGTWETILPIPSGVHRVNVRIDGAGWLVPAGTTRSSDDFGGEVGIVSVP